MERQMKNLVRMIAALFVTAAVAVFASNAQSTDNTVAWHGKTDTGKVVWRHVKNGGKRGYAFFDELDRNED